MNTLKLPKLKHGDVIGIVAPSSPPRTQEAVEQGISYLEKLGYRVEISSNVFSRYGYLAGADEIRANELNAMFANKNVKAIFVARGGYGLHRILSKINFSLIKRNPKIVVGYSDVTALQLALWKKCNLVSLSAPLVVEFKEKLTGEKEELFWSLLTSSKRSNFSYAITTNPVKQTVKKIKGMLLGGNLSLISALCGTKYLPSFKNALLFCEDVGEEPYRVDRMLQHLKLANGFKQTSGIVLGDFSSCERKNEISLSLQQVFSDTFANMNVPIISGLQYGHIKETYSIPIGIQAEIDAKKNKMRLMESLVE